MSDNLIETGKIVNTHGVRGEVKIEPWADSPEVLAGLKRFFIDGEPVDVVSARVHKNCVIAALGGVDGLDAAIKLKNKHVSIDRSDIVLEEGRYFVADLIGLRAVDADSREELGVVADVLSLPSNDVYVIRGEREILVPAVPDFVVETCIDEGFIALRLIEGM
ncbi:MAG: ribosome maturation factor RimM [Oscillospiraceae bacterium]|nr:ribosome maturation factor RimM [Oscillospiraceae bacterium]